MPIAANKRSITGTIGAAVTAALLGVDTLTGNWTFVARTSPRSTSGVAIALPTGESGTIRIDPITVPFQGAVVDHLVRLDIIAERDTSQAIADDQTALTIHEFKNGGSVRSRLTAYLRTDPDNMGLTFRQINFFGSGSEATAGAQIYPPQVPLGKVFELALHLKLDSLAGKTTVALNGQAMTAITGANTTSGLPIAEARSRWTITLPAVAGIRWVICGFDSWTDSDFSVRPRYEVADRPYSDVPQASAFRHLPLFAVNDPVGGTWNRTSNITTIASSNYDTSGIHMYRRRDVYTGTSGQTATLSTIDSVGTPPWSNKGRCAFIFPRSKIPGSATLVLALRNAANNADVIAVTVSNGTITQGATTIGTVPNTADLAIALEIDRGGRAVLNLIGTNIDASSRYFWCFRLADFTPAATYGKIEQRLTLGSASCELDGCWIGPSWANSQVDSTSSTRNTTTDYHHPRNHFGAACMSGAMWENVPGGSWVGRDSGTPAVPLLIACGRSGRTRNEVSQYCLDHMTQTMAADHRVMDFGSINDVNAINGGDGTAIVERELNQFESWLWTQLELGNRVSVSTMLRRDNDQYFPQENAAIDQINTGCREIVARLGPAYPGQLEFFDAARELSNNADYIDTDKTHPSVPGRSKWWKAYAEKRQLVA